LFFAEVPLVISYYTLGTPYEEEVKNLLDSCREWGIEHHVKGVKDLGSWEQNCAYKPRFILEQMQKWQRPLLWVDADAVFLQPLAFEEFMFADIALMWETGKTDPRFCVRAGTIFVRPTGEHILSLWKHYAEEIEQREGRALAFQDQASLYFAVLASKQARIAALPLTYCALFDERQEGVVIKHYQASRRFCKKKD